MLVKDQEKTIDVKTYIWSWQKVLVTVVRDFGPNILITNMGCDDEAAAITWKNEQIIQDEGGYISSITHTAVW